MASNPNIHDWNPATVSRKKNPKDFELSETIHCKSIYIVQITILLVASRLNSPWFFSCRRWGHDSCALRVWCRSHVARWSLGSTLIPVRGVI
jgi:hypothetical protein